jgi:hypothetical protein
MERVRHHLSVADTVIVGKIDTGHHDLNAELIFLLSESAGGDRVFIAIGQSQKVCYGSSGVCHRVEWPAHARLRGER